MPYKSEFTIFEQLPKAKTMSTSNQQADTTRTNVAQGSSTGAPGAPLSTQDTRSQYDPATTGYNSATGAGYSTSSAGGPHHHHHQPPSPPNDYDRGGQDDRIQYAPSTAQRVQMEDEAKTGSTASGQKDATTGPWSARASEQAGRKAKGVMASVHVSFIFPRTDSMGSR